MLHLYTIPVPGITFPVGHRPDLKIYLSCSPQHSLLFARLRRSCSSIVQCIETNADNAGASAPRSPQYAETGIDKPRGTRALIGWFGGSLPALGNIGGKELRVPGISALIGPLAPRPFLVHHEVG